MGSDRLEARNGIGCQRSDRRVVLDPAGASQLSGLLGSTAKSGTVTVKLPALDARFRETGASLVTVVEQVREKPLIDRKQAAADLRCRR